MVIVVCFAAPTMSKTSPLRGVEKSSRSVLRRSSHDTSSTFSSASVVDVDMDQSQVAAFLSASATMFDPSWTVWTYVDLILACRTPNSVTGVTGCTPTGYPTGLSLPNSHSGPSTYTLSPDLGALSELASMELDIASSNFVGTLPAGWSTLTKLENLTIYSSSLGGASLPEEWSGMTSLQNLLLYFTSSDNFALDASPPSWVSRLKTVDLSSVSIGPSNDLPESWFTSDSITTLSLYLVNCTGRVSSSVTSNTVIQNLYITLAGSISPAMPSDLSAMTSLISVGLGDFTGTLPSKYPPSLEKAGFSGSNITGTIPQSLFDSPNLVFVDLSYMNVHGDLPAPSSPLTSKLESIEVAFLPLTGTISNNYFHMPNFKDFSARYPGDLSPSSFGAMPSAGGCGLTRFVCLNCSISGTIPSDLPTACPHLERLSLSNNYLTGTIPMGWGGKFNGVQLDGNSLDLCGAPENTANFTDATFPSGCIIAPQYGYDYCNCSSIWSTRCQTQIPCDGSPTTVAPYELPPFIIPTPSTTPVTSPDQQPSVTPSVIPSPDGSSPSSSPSPPTARVPEPISSAPMMASTLAAVMCAVIAVIMM